MTILKREEIFGFKDIKTEVVEVPEWGGSVIVKCMTGSERDEFEQSCLSRDGKRLTLDNIRAKLICKTVVDEDGNKLFSTADVESLGAKSAVALDRIFTVAQKLSGMTKEDIDELTKN